jgi:MGT family glycosyltransferase
MFVTWPAVGHLNPTLKLARKLQKLGHRVCYLGLADHEKYLSFQGVEFFNISDEIGSLNQFKDGFFDRWFQIRQILHEIRPNLLVVDEIIAEFAFRAEMIGIPSVLVSTKLQEFPYKLSNDESVNFASNSTVLVLCPQEFDFPIRAKQKGHHYIEASIDLERRELRSFPWDKLDKSKSLIYCSFGSHSDQYEQSLGIMANIIEAIEHRTECQLVLVADARLYAPIYRRIPENVLIVDWAPQLEILKKASIMITHGGLGAIKECIFFGVPMIVVPMMWDQPVNAERVVYHGLGLQANPSLLTSQLIDSFIDKLNSDASFRVRVASMSKVFKKAEDYGKGVKIIESILRGFSDHDAEKLC